jgi:multisubunit Na+/H+ antiporter MnhC subunit
MALLLTVSISVLFAARRVHADAPELRQARDRARAARSRGEPADLHRGAPRSRPAAARPAGRDVAASPYSDPLPGALILTAIVISFGIVSYTIVLIKRTYQDVGTDDLDELTTTDR